MKQTVTFLALVVALLVGQAAPAAQQGPAQASRAKTVEISNFKFRPATLNVTKGTEVFFSNSSNTAHTATDRGAFDTGRIKAGKAAAVRFGQRGTYSYHCKIHPGMSGKVLVG
jgi:plastocyanin